MPLSAALKLIHIRNTTGSRSYLGKKKKDVHEKDKTFLKNSVASAHWLAKTQKNWIKIECAVGGKIDTRENIHQKIYEKTQKIIK